MERAGQASVPVTGRSTAGAASRTGMAAHTLQSCLRAGSQAIRTHGPHEKDHVHVAVLMGETLSYELLRVCRGPTCSAWQSG
jgi:hypothetical protein